MYYKQSKMLKDPETIAQTLVVTQHLMAHYDVKEIVVRTIKDMAVDDLMIYRPVKLAYVV